jgi:nucleotide-binding universal stress UspA family protein
MEDSMTTIAGPVPLTTRLVAARRTESHVVQAKVRDAILLATDGASGSTDAVGFAIALSRRTGAPLQILAALEPLPLGVDQDAALIPAVDLLQVREDNLHCLVRDQVRAVIGDQPVGINVQYGRAAQVVAEAARGWGARLVVAGLGRHDPAARVYGSETALRIAAAAPVPTLAIAPGFVSLPTTAVVAVDFSDASERAALATTRVVAAGGEVCLVHVNPFPHDESGEAQGWETVYLAGVRSLFGQVARKLHAANKKLTIRTVLAEGRPAERVLEIAAQLGADLVTAGRHGATAVRGERVGGTTASVLRGATCSVLVAP